MYIPLVYPDQQNGTVTAMFNEVVISDHTKYSVRYWRRKVFILCQIALFRCFVECLRGYDFRALDGSAVAYTVA